MLTGMFFVHWYAREPVTPVAQMLPAGLNPCHMALGLAHTQRVQGAVPTHSSRQGAYAGGQR